ncbi:hypothetical protein EDC01DRAFT_733187 [Geopyxis carbonaria]|nr:hypothetical protein EDC01DRAFT_733187 [Geopyxis carbonaria]
MATNASSFEQAFPPPPSQHQTLWIPPPPNLSAVQAELHAYSAARSGFPSVPADTFAPADHDTGLCNCCPHAGTPLSPFYSPADTATSSVFLSQSLVHPPPRDVAVPSRRKSAPRDSAVLARHKALPRDPVELPEDQGVNRVVTAEYTQRYIEQRAQDGKLGRRGVSQEELDAPFRYCPREKKILPQSEFEPDYRTKVPVKPEVSKPRRKHRRKVPAEPAPDVVKKTVLRETEEEKDSAEDTEKVPFVKRRLSKRLADTRTPIKTTATGTKRKIVVEDTEIKEEEEEDQPTKRRRLVKHVVVEVVRPEEDRNDDIKEEDTEIAPGICFG